jgi:iron complex transport system substrate-binding protein
MRAVTRSSTRTRLARAAASAAVFVLVCCSEGERPASPAPPPRLVSLAPNVTEILFAVGRGPAVVGTDDFSNFPEAAKRLPKVGGMQPDIEKIVALKPTLVVASTEGNHPNLAPALKAVNVPLMLLRTDRLADIPAAMRAFDGNDVAARLDRDIAAQKRTRAEPPRILFAVWTDPLYVAGRETFTDDLYALAGAQNAVQVKGWPQYSLESLVAHPPDLILYPKGSVTPQQIATLLARAPGIRSRVVPVDDDIFQRPGPRVVDAAKALNAILDRGQ